MLTVRIYGIRQLNDFLGVINRFIPNIEVLKAVFNLLSHDIVGPDRMVNRSAIGYQP